jgi:hypothetical protein
MYFLSFINQCLRLPSGPRAFCCLFAGSDQKLRSCLVNCGVQVRAAQQHIPPQRLPLLQRLPDPETAMNRSLAQSQARGASSPLQTVKRHAAMRRHFEPSRLRFQKSIFKAVTIARNVPFEHNSRLRINHSITDNLYSFTFGSQRVQARCLLTECSDHEAAAMARRASPSHLDISAEFSNCMNRPKTRD